MSTDYDPATWIPTTHFWSGRRGYTPRWIILHGSGGGSSAETVARDFQGDDPPTSAHYVVGLSGEIVQSVAESDSAWANGILSAGHDAWWSPSLNPNFQTLSIELVKTDAGNRNQLTQAQKQATFALIAHLCQKWNIPAQLASAAGGVTGHQSIDPVSRANCPGVFPWDELWAYLAAQQSGTYQQVPQAIAQSGPSSGLVPAGGVTTAAKVPTGWHDDGQTLTAPNGLPVKLGFRWYILNHPWDADNWPLEGMQAVETVDVNNPHAGRGSIQHFRKNILVWEEATGAVYELWAGAVALTYQQRAAPSTPASTPPTPASGGLVPYASPLGASGQLGSQMSGQMGSQAGAAFSAAPLSMAIPIGQSLAPLASAGAAAAVATAVATAPVPSPVSSPMPSLPLPSLPLANPPQVTPPLTYVPSGVSAGQLPSGDPLGQRVNQLERNLRLLVDGLSRNGKTRNIVRQFEQDAQSEMSSVLGNQQVRQSLFSNPRVIVRWILMILGLIFSDVVAWAVSMLAHHSGPVPLPLLTVGTLLSGVVFLGVFGTRPHM